MPLKLYNTLNRKKEPFKPQADNIAKVYCCGPTVYNYAHIGNLRTYIYEDVLVKTLKLAGFDVNHVMNITDVGHLTDDGDEGEDKMLIAAKREHKSVLEIARMYEDVFFKHSKALGINKPNIVCRATEHINEMIDFVKTLENKGFAYFSGGNVYFDTAKFAEYGKLSGQKREDLKHGARITEDANKKNPSDFVLWFTSSKFENQILQWDSPWGMGYPGWHVECSAMAIKYLGDRVDIHCGGIDHIPVHHENEIAQSEAYLGHKWVENWLHTEFLQMKDGKMSKSKGEFITVDTLTKNGYDPLDYRYFVLMSHYKSPAVFSYQALDAAKTAYQNLKDRVLLAQENKNTKNNDTDLLSEYKTKFNNFIFDDMATPQALALIWQAIKDEHLSNASKLDFVAHFDKVFSLNLSNIKKEELVLTSEQLQLIEDRKQAKINKDYKKSDEIRNLLLSQGIGLKDKANNEVDTFKV